MKGAVIQCMILLAVLAFGCSRQVGQADEDERDHPLMARAYNLEQSGDLEGARRIYKVLLEKHPDMGRAHLGLALLLDRREGDPVGAIYHYQRYLEVRPETEKKAMIEGRIRSATAAMVHRVYGTEASVAKRLAQLEQENRELRVRCGNLETRLKHSQLTLRNCQNRQAEMADKGLKSSGLMPAEIRPAVKSIRVQKNDTLRHIAMRAYGSQTRWKEIYEANRNVLEKPEDVRNGQILVLPE